MKGIILAGGAGTRLNPLTKVVSKQLLPVYNKPMIYYPLSTLMLAGIREILIITTKESNQQFKNLFKNGEDLGISIDYAIQEKPNGLAEAIIIGKDFIGNSDVTLILGDNIFIGNNLGIILKDCIQKVCNEKKAIILGYSVKDPKRFGVVSINKEGEITTIEEKPPKPNSNLAIVGLYFYPNSVIEKVGKVRPSDRGELEITDLNQIFLNERKLLLQRLGRGITWFDTGTFASLQKASLFVEIQETASNYRIGVLEEIAYNSGFIDNNKLKELSLREKNEYYEYLKKITS